MNLKQIFIPLTFIGLSLSFNQAQAQTKTIAYPNGEKHTIDCADFAKIDGKKFFSCELIQDLEFHKGPKFTCVNGTNKAEIESLARKDPKKAAAMANNNLVAAIAHWSAMHGGACHDQNQTLLVKQAKNKGKTYTPEPKNGAFCPMQAALNVCPN